MEKKVAHIVPYRKLRRTVHYFDYAIPAELSKAVREGQMVEIPLGLKTIQGILLGFTDNPEVPYETLKPIRRIINDTPLLAAWQLALLKWAAGYYCSSASLFVKMMVPELPKRVATKRVPDTKYLFETPEEQSFNLIPVSRKPQLIKTVSFEKKISWYRELIRTALKNKKQILILFPTVHELYRHYRYLGEWQDRISLISEKTAKNEYYREYMRIKENEVTVILGTRSAIFAPFQEIGMIVIDQENNENLKQEEPNPRYHARTIAEKIHELTSCSLYLVAVTPSIESLYKVHEKVYDYAELDLVAQIPSITIVDRNREFAGGNFSVLSECLKTVIRNSLQDSSKVFLYLNRKGGATTVSCRDCGFIFVSPESQLPLTQFNLRTLRSPHGDHTQEMPLLCTRCKSPHLKLSGAGTEKLAEEVRKEFPEARILKLDADTPLPGTIIKAPIEYADIIIGTNYALPLIDWKHIGAIGVISADTALYLPDFRSSEHTFSLLYNFAVCLQQPHAQLIVQTCNPEQYLFRALSLTSIKDFYVNEIKERRLLSYPPFSTVIKVIIQDPVKKYAQKKAQSVYEDLMSSRSATVQVLPPIPAHETKIRGRFRWYIIIKLLGGSGIPEVLNHMPDDILIDVDPISLI